MFRFLVSICLMLIALPFILLSMTLSCVNAIVSKTLTYLTAVVFAVPLVLLKIKDTMFKTNDVKSVANLISKLQREKV